MFEKESDDLIPPREGEDDPGRQPGASNRRKRLGCNHLILACILLALISIPFIKPITNLGRKIKRGVVEIVHGKREPGEERIREVVREREKIVEITIPPELPKEFVPRIESNNAKLWNGIQVKPVLDLKEGDRTSIERENPDSYTFELRLNLHVPRANQTLDDLAKLNKHLPALLPGLAQLMAGAKVSEFYHGLYDIKRRSIQAHATELNITRLLSRHNFFDCETILELQHPDTKQKVLLMQGEMDVVSDGSDGDRMSNFDNYIAKSSHFQPFTSYGWKKTTNNPNPLLARWQANLAKAEKEFAVKGLSAEKNRYLRGRISQLKREVADLKSRSYLIAQADPFAVVPGFMLGYAKKNAFAPRIGDYCLVVYNDMILPAIIGDAGPSSKMGEASLRIAKQLNKKASPYSRPVSDLKVTYLIFPGSADKPFGPPDLKKWHARCSELVKKIGGLGEKAKIHEWKDLFEKEAKPEENPEPEVNGGTPSPASVTPAE